MVGDRRRWHSGRFKESRQQIQLLLTTMTKSRFHLSRILAILAGAVTLASSGVAATLTISTNGSSNGNGLGGGSYTISGSGLDTSAYAPISLVGPAGTFESFCLEYTEYFSPGSTYNYTVSNAAVAGAGGAVGGQDPISVGTAWLYSQFANGTLSGFNYGAGRSASNNFLQLAFWFFEDETPSISGYGPTYGSGDGNAFLDSAVAFFGSEAAAKADANGAYGVQVLNLTSRTGHNKQSQLYISVPDAGSTLALLGMGIAALVGIQRLRRRRL